MSKIALKIIIFDQYLQILRKFSLYFLMHIQQLHKVETSLYTRGKNLIHTWIISKDVALTLRVIRLLVLIL